MGGAGIDKVSTGLQWSHGNPPTPPPVNSQAEKLTDITENNTFPHVHLRAVNKYLAEKFTEL